MLLLFGDVNVQSMIFIFQHPIQVGLQTQSIPPELVKAAFGRSVEVGLPHFLHLYLFFALRSAGWLLLNQGKESFMR